MRKLYSKKLLALLLSASMVLGTAASAFAAEPYFQDVDQEMQAATAGDIFFDISPEGSAGEQIVTVTEDGTIEPFVPAADVNIFSDVEEAESAASVFEDVFAEVSDVEEVEDAVFEELEAEEIAVSDSTVVKVGELSILLPETWKGKYTLEEEDGILWFVHAASRQKGASGKLFGIYACTDASWMQNENMTGILPGMDCQYVWVTPNDVELYTAETAEEYTSLYEGLPSIQEAIQIDYGENEAAAMVGATNAQKLFNYMVGYGYTKQAAAALVGNVMAEAGGGLNFSLHAVEVGTGIGVGMCQWSFGRRTNFENYCLSQGVRWTNSDLELQTKFLIKELEGDYGNMWVYYSGYSSSKLQYKISYNAFRTSTNIDIATGAFCCCFERPSEVHMNLSTRITNAKQVYNLYSGSVTVGYNPEGSLDRVTGGRGTLRVQGWAFDRSDLSKAIEVHVILKNPSTGATVYTHTGIMADQMRTDVGSAFPNAGNYHGFDSTFEVNVPAGTYVVNVNAINIGTSATSTNYNTLLTNSGKTVAIETKAYTGETGMVSVDGKYYYINTNGNYATGWKQIDGRWYYFDPNTYNAATGFNLIGTCTYYFDAAGRMVTGFFNLSGATYYANESGHIAHGLAKINNSLYFFDPTNGVMRTGWRQADGVWYYFDLSDGTAITDLVKIGTKMYYFNSEGKMQTGFQVIDGKVYYFNAAGQMEYGLVQVDGKRYYFDPTTGVRRSGWVQENGNWYFFDAANNYVAVTGIQKIGTCTYGFTADGVMQVGLTDFGNGKIYYFDRSGHMVFGFQTIDGNLFCFDSTTGVMRTGWVKDSNGYWYYIDPSTYHGMKGFQKIGTCTYYFNDAYQMQTGLQTIDGKTYYFDANGHMAYGITRIGNNFYYFNTSTGVKETSGWRSYNNIWYFLGNDGICVSGFQTIGTCTYYFNSSCQMVTGFQTIDGKVYYFNNAGQAQTGRFTFNGTIYEFGSDFVGTPVSTTAQYRIFVGDSRTVGMSSSVGSVSNTKFIGKVGEGLTWLKNTAAAQMGSAINSTNAYTTVYLWFGVNDMGNINGYISYYSSLMKQYPNTRFVIAGVGPVNEALASRNGYSVAYVNNTAIENFNRQMKAAFPENYLDVYSFMVNNGYYTSDGIHYTSTTYKSVYDYMRSH